MSGSLGARRRRRSTAAFPRRAAEEGEGEAEARGAALPQEAAGAPVQEQARPRLEEVLRVLARGRRLPREAALLARVQERPRPEVLLELAQGRAQLPARAPSPG